MGHLLVCTCIHTGYTCMQLLTGISTSDVLLGLLTVQQKYTAIKLVLADAGTQFLVDIDNYSPRNQLEHKLLVTLKKTIQAGTRGQSGNYTEQKIQEIKKIWASLFGNTTTTLPPLTYAEV